jgi:hypothetical protein
MQTLPFNCDNCAAELEAADNFCRHCGSAAVRHDVPAVRSSAALTVWKPNPSPVVKGAAVMAAGTIGQFLVRRAVASLLARPDQRHKRSRGRRKSRGDDGMLDETQIITETVMMRRVRIRRPA